MHAYNDFYKGKYGTIDYNLMPEPLMADGFATLY